MKRRWGIRNLIVICASVLAHTACAKAGNPSAMEPVPQERMAELGVEHDDLKLFQSGDGAHVAVMHACAGTATPREDGLCCAIMAEIMAGINAPHGEKYKRAKEEEVVRLINEERAKVGLEPVTLDENVMDAAEIRAHEQEELFSHTRPDGSNCFTVFPECHVDASYRGENVGAGSICTPQQIMDAWMQSPSHRENILNPNFHRVGVGCYEVSGHDYWSQVFAN